MDVCVHVWAICLSSPKPVTPIRRSVCVCVYVCDSATSWLVFLQVEVIFHIKNTVSLKCVFWCWGAQRSDSTPETEQDLYAWCCIWPYASSCTTLGVSLYISSTLTHTHSNHILTFTPLKPPLGEMGRSFHVQMLFIFFVKAAQIYCGVSPLLGPCMETHTH